MATKMRCTQTRQQQDNNNKTSDAKGVWGIYCYFLFWCRAAFFAKSKHQYSSEERGWDIYQSTQARLNTLSFRLRRYLSFRSASFSFFLDMTSWVTNVLCSLSGIEAASMHIRSLSLSLSDTRTHVHRTGRLGGQILRIDNGYTLI